MAEAQNDQREKEFRKKSQWLAFKTSVYSALSTATFLGVVGKLVATALEIFGPNAEMSKAALTNLSSPLMLGAMGAAIAVGVVFTYWSQDAYTDLAYVRDEHMAERTAQCHAKEKALEKARAAQPQEHAQNCRSDGQQWATVTKRQNSASIQMG